MKLHHVAIPVRDLERARAFYVDVLGLPEIRRQAHSIWVQADGAIVMLEKGAPAPDAHCIAFAIGAGERAQWAGKVTVESATAFTIYTRDPDGHRIGLTSYPDPAVP